MPVSVEVETYRVAEELLLQAFQVKVLAVAQKLGAVVLVFDVERIAAEQVEELGEDFGAPVRHRGWHDRWRPDEIFSVETREDLRGGSEENGKSQREVVRGVARIGEKPAWDLEVQAADRDEDVLLV